MAQPQTDILLACYNGQAYLEAQLQSILAQTDPHWRLWVRDDGSSDNTPAILKAWAQKDPRIVIVEDGLGPQGAAKNFICLLAHATAPHVMFCDQDDVWHPGKIEKTLRCFQTLEQRFGKAPPLLVHTDLRVVDEKGEEIAPSMAAYQKLDANRTSFAQLLVQNVVTGCTVMINQPLAAKLKGYPDGAILHDWYAALIASAFGALGAVTAPTIDYRQHGQNQVGSKNVKSLGYLARRAASRASAQNALRQTYRQAAAFYAQFQADLSREQAEMVQAYAALPQKPKPARWRTLSRFGLWKQGWVRKIGQWFYC